MPQPAEHNAEPSPMEGSQPERMRNRTAAKGLQAGDARGRGGGNEGALGARERRVTPRRSQAVRRPSFVRIARDRPRRPHHPRPARASEMVGWLPTPEWAVSLHA